jgi:hypothetical protein
VRTHHDYDEVMKTSPGSSATAVSHQSRHHSVSVSIDAAHAAQRNDSQAAWRETWSPDSRESLHAYHRVFEEEDAGVTGRVSLNKGASQHRASAAHSGRRDMRTNIITRRAASAVDANAASHRQSSSYKPASESHYIYQRGRHDHDTDAGSAHAHRNNSGLIQTHANGKPSPTQRYGTHVAHGDDHASTRDHHVRQRKRTDGLAGVLAATAVALVERHRTARALDVDATGRVLQAAGDSHESDVRVHGNHVGVEYGGSVGAFAQGHGHVKGGQSLPGNSRADTRGKKESVRQHPGQSEATHADEMQGFMARNRPNFPRVDDEEDLVFVSVPRDVGSDVCTQTDDAVVEAQAPQVRTHDRSMDTEVGVAKVKRKLEMRVDDAGMSVCVCVYVCMYVCIYIYIYIY